jgi:hypothetical protein
MQDKKAMMDESHLRVKAGHDVFVSDALASPPTAGAPKINSAAAMRFSISW